MLKYKQFTLKSSSGIIDTQTTQIYFYQNVEAVLANGPRTVDTRNQTFRNTSQWFAIDCWSSR